MFNITWIKYFHFVVAFHYSFWGEYLSKRVQIPIWCEAKWPDNTKWMKIFDLKWFPQNNTPKESSRTFLTFTWNHLKTIQCVQNWMWTSSRVTDSLKPQSFLFNRLWMVRNKNSKWEDFPCRNVMLLAFWFFFKTKTWPKQFTGPEDSHTEHTYMFGNVYRSFPVKCYMCRTNNKWNSKYISCNRGEYWINLDFHFSRATINWMHAYIQYTLIILIVL